MVCKNFISYSQLIVTVYIPCFMLYKSLFVSIALSVCDRAYSQTDGYIKTDDRNN